MTASRNGSTCPQPAPSSTTLRLRPVSGSRSASTRRTRSNTASTGAARRMSSGGVRADGTGPARRWRGLHAVRDHDSASDSPTTALTIVTPPNGPLFLPLGEFPCRRTPRPSASSSAWGRCSVTSRSTPSRRSGATRYRCRPRSSSATTASRRSPARRRAGLLSARRNRRDVGRLDGAAGRARHPAWRALRDVRPPRSRPDGVQRLAGDHVEAVDVVRLRHHRLVRPHRRDRLRQGVGATRYWLLRDGRQMHGALAVISEGGTSPESRTLIHPPGPSGEFATSAYAATMATIYAWTVSEVIG